MIDVEGFLDKGWAKFPAEPQTIRWLEGISLIAKALAEDPDIRDFSLRDGGRFFDGRGLLPNDDSGALARSGPLTGQAVRALCDFHNIDAFSWGKGDISVAYPGYPALERPGAEAAYRWKIEHDDARMDGLAIEPVSAQTRIKGHHAFQLGVGVTGADAGAAPLVIYEGSHKIGREHLYAALGGTHPNDWDKVDLSEAFRRSCEVSFERSVRQEVPLEPGEIVVLHRHLLHGTGIWQRGAMADPDGRMTLWFRPRLGWSARDWLARP